ncbi:MAG TPA: polyprenyl synthetase family protein [Kiritimatiellia bacterium]|nr:polyprenyl synthetase family protein [Kiritimatiellia bacterium]
MIKSTFQPDVDHFLAEVRKLMAEGLSDTVLNQLPAESSNILASGKMLRSRLCFRVGIPAGVNYRTLLYASAAVEMIHAASLLHDDVIDGGQLRRGAPTFWVQRGIPGAILVGDLMLFKALDLTCDLENGALTRKLIKLTGEVCDAESEQELLLRGYAPSWENCIKIARRKTGALFAFSAFACSKGDPKLGDILLEAGYEIGTAYQLADDILDATGSTDTSGKSLGSDVQRNKTTAATTASALPELTIDQAVAYVHELCDQALRQLKPWPNVHRGWTDFMELDMKPALDLFLAATRPPAVALP